MVFVWSFLQQVGRVLSVETAAKKTPYHHHVTLTVSVLLQCVTVVSEEKGVLKCSVKNRMKIKLDAKQERTVFTPSAADFQVAYSQL